MSGETPRVVLVGGSEIERLVGVLGRISALDSRFTLVGGVAVVARLAEVHRATSDLDTVTEGDGFAEAVVALPAAVSKSGTLFVDGVKIDTIEVSNVGWDAVAAVQDPGARLFAAAHLWALKEASTITIDAGEASALVSVATPPALLGTKLHAFHSPARGSEKHSSDAWDVYRLAQMVISDAEQSFLDAPRPVVASVRWVVEEHLRKDPAKLAGRLRRLPSFGASVTEAEIRALAELLLDALPPTATRR